VFQIILIALVQCGAIVKVNSGRVLGDKYFGIDGTHASPNVARLEDGWEVPQKTIATSFLESFKEPWSPIKCSQYFHAIFPS
jgi:hypothetical protein